MFQCLGCIRMSHQQLEASLYLGSIVGGREERDQDHHTEQVSSNIVEDAAASHNSQQADQNSLTCISNGVSTKSCSIYKSRLI